MPSHVSTERRSPTGITPLNRCQLPKFLLIQGLSLLAMPQNV